MKQHPKRKDLVKRTFLLPKEIDDWISETSAKTKESKNLVIARFLESVKNFQKSLPKS